MQSLSFAASGIVTYGSIAFAYFKMMRKNSRNVLRVMDLFYEMAMLTIVAASGDAWSGLPGVAPTPRRQNRIVREIVPGLKMTTIVDMDTILRKSVYSSRAWTCVDNPLRCFY
jgi:hypothetical protein